MKPLSAAKFKDTQGLSQDSQTLQGQEDEYDEERQALERGDSYSQREVRRSSSIFTRGFAAAIAPDARRGSVLGFTAGALPVLQAGVPHLCKPDLCSDHSVKLPPKTRFLPFSEVMPGKLQSLGSLVSTTATCKLYSFP